MFKRIKEVFKVFKKKKVVSPLELKMQERWEDSTAEEKRIYNLPRKIPVSEQELMDMMLEAEYEVKRLKRLLEKFPAQHEVSCHEHSLGMKSRNIGAFTSTSDTTIPTVSSRKNVGGFNQIEKNVKEQINAHWNKSPKKKWFAWLRGK